MAKRFRPDLSSSAINVSKQNDLDTSMSNSESVSAFEKFAHTSAEKTKYNTENSEEDIESKNNEVEENPLMESSKDMDAHLIKKRRDEIKMLKDERNSLQNRLNEAKNQMRAMKAEHEKNLKERDNEIAAIKSEIKYYETCKLVLTLKCYLNEIEKRDLQQAIDKDMSLPQNEAHAISLISVFLDSCPGSSIDTVYSFVRQINPSIGYSCVESILQSLSHTFEQKVSSDGIRESLWYFKNPLM